MIRLNDFDIYYPKYTIRIPDDLANKNEFIDYTKKSFKASFMYNFEKTCSEFSVSNYRYVT